MKGILSIMALLTGPALLAQFQPVPSHVYQWNDLVAKQEETRIRRQVLEGSTTDLEYLEVHTSTLAPGMAPHPPHTHDDVEELVIVKEGQLKVTIKDQSKVLGPGSVAVAIPGDEHGFENAGETPVTYYIFKYRSKLPMDVERARKAGGSFMIDARDVAFTPHDKGGIKRYFERPTSMFERLEMHVTTLNEGLKSHAPHTHRAAEFVLMMKGDASMQIGDTFNEASPGALIFLASQIPHALENVGKGACEYFAFQIQ